MEGKIKLLKTKRAKRLFAALAGITLILAVLVYARHRHRATATGATSPQASNQAAAAPSRAADNATTPGSGSKAQTDAAPAAPISDQASTNGSLAAPSGQLGSGTNSASASCLTVSGATCVVSLSGPGGQTKTIDPDSSSAGSFTFDWSTSGYAPGSWTVQIVATKDGHSARTTLGQLEVRG